MTIFRLDFVLGMIALFGVMALGLMTVSEIKKARKAGKKSRFLDVTDFIAKLLVAPGVGFFCWPMFIGLLVWVRVLGEKTHDWRNL